MTKTNIILLVIEIILVFVFLCLILYKYSKEKLDNILHRLNEAEDECVNNLKTKYDLLLEMIKIIETKYKVESKTKTIAETTISSAIINPFLFIIYITFFHFLISLKIIKLCKNPQVRTQHSH